MGDTCISPSRLAAGVSLTLTGKPKTDRIREVLRPIVFHEGKKCGKQWMMSKPRVVNAALTLSVPELPRNYRRPLLE
jgi:hypothetical protein